MKTKQTRGGKRKGSGRPKGEPTKTISVRVPEKHYPELKDLLNNTVNDFIGERKC
jgi:hypothetical protein